MRLLNPLTHVEAIIIVLVLAGISKRLKLLDRSGVIASIPVGYLIYTFGGPEYFILLLAFYAVSGAATKFRVKRIGREIMDKDWIRGWRNVAANGSMATVISVLNMTGISRQLLTAAYLGAVGTAFADTLATEIGLLYPGRPRLVTNLKKVPRGTPGAASPYGYMGGFLALLFLAALSLLIGVRNPRIMGSLLISGIVGTTIDSFLGATIQSKYRCQICGKLTENKHHCGKTADLVSGIPIIDTHAVNLISTAAGALIAAALTTILTS